MTKVIQLTAEEARADAALAAERIAEVLGRPAPAPNLIQISPLLELRRQACGDCEWHNDSIVTGEPLSPPCRLSPAWTICRWRGAQNGGEVPADPRCPWHGLPKDPPLTPP